MSAVPWMIPLVGRLPSLGMSRRDTFHTPDDELRWKTTASPGVVRFIDAGRPNVLYPTFASGSPTTARSPMIDTDVPKSPMPLSVATELVPHTPLDFS